ncbi:MAG: hypothetical protein A3K30_06750 [Deltaproteobacteria bacterium RBG_13_51_10]|nr:MAG: hypothetical protein A3K30_06750 [Deltaproteobacteria bacterium RBG_13_51_10]
MRNSSESKEHAELINMMVRHFIGQGARNVRADISGVTTPDVIHGTKQDHVPDLTVDKNGTRIILEAETSSTISDSHTASQWSLFSDAAQKAGGEFHVVVPKGYRGEAQQRATALAIKVHTIWTLS